MNQSIKALYRAFSPAPLTLEQSDLYVPLDPVRGDLTVVERLAEQIRLSDQPVSQVIAGHKGSGKSTELIRLQEELENGDPRYFVVFCKADEDIDRNDVDFPDLLIAIIRQIAKQLRDRANIELKPGYFEKRWERLKTALGSEVSFEGLKLDAGMLEIAAPIKSSPDVRQEVRKLLEPDTTNWLKAANDVIGEAVLELQKQNYDNLVVVVDDLDKMVVRSVDHAECSTVEYLFIHRAGQLTAFNCPVVYTLPLSLAYSHHEQTIKNSFGGHVPVVPMIKIASRPPESKPYKPGIDRMQKIIKARCEAAGTKPADVFKSAPVRRKLLQLSGGQPSELMILVREAIITAGLPINGKALDRARREGMREYARMLRAEHWPILETIRQSGRYDRSEETETLFRELIDSRAILQYVNKDEWYGLNPMVAELEPPPPATSPSQ